MDFFTKYKRPAPVLEHPDPVSKVETQGYIPADVQIMRMIDAGRRLDNFRRENFDFGSEEEVEDDFIDPTRSPGFDMSDASQLAKSVGRNGKKRAEKENPADEKDSAGDKKGDDGVKPEEK